MADDFYSIHMNKHVPGLEKVQQPVVVVVGVVVVVVVVVVEKTFVSSYLSFLPILAKKKKKFARNIRHNLELTLCRLSEFLMMMIMKISCTVCTVLVRVLFEV